MISLYVLQGPDKGRQFNIKDDLVPLGRNSELVPLSDLTVSRNHAHLKKLDGSWSLYDEGSANGVFINGVRIVKQGKVKVGDQIRMGSTLLVFGAPKTASLEESEDIKLLDGGRKGGDSAIISTVPSSDDSVILAAPEPSAAAMTHFRVLLQLAQAISITFDQDELLNRVMDIVFEQLRADRGFIGLLREDAPDDGIYIGRVIPRVVRYRDEEQVGKIGTSQTIIQHVLSTSEGVLASNAMTDQRFSKGKSVHSLAIRSAICVPIKGRDRNLGVIQIDTMVANFSYTQEQLRLLTAIGQQTGVAIQNLRLYRENVQRERLAATGETVANLSHSVKNILQGLRGGADVVDIGLKNSSIDQVKQGWGMLQRNLDKVHDLTMNMLAYAKDRKPAFEMTLLPHVLAECLELVKQKAKDKRVELLTEVDESQPPVPVDADGLHQAVLNLLGNAVDAVDQGRGRVTLTSEFDIEQNQAIIEVQDNGMGIKPEDLGKIFQPFFSTKGQKGTGLGLAVTKKIIEEHDGKISVSSKRGMGTTFQIRLPLSHGKGGPASSETHGPPA